MYIESCNELKEFNRLYKEGDDIYHKIAVKQGISDSAFMILYAIEVLNQTRQKDIADYYCISKQTINSSIKKLIQSGIIKQSTSKGRDVFLELTPSGKKFVEEKIIPIIDLENDTFAQMGEKESRELLRLTKKYLDIFKEKVTKYYED